MKKLLIFILAAASAIAQYAPMGGGIIYPKSIAGTFTLAHSSPATLGSCTGTGTTCSVALSASISAGNFLGVVCKTSITGSSMPQSINVGGTFIPVYSASGAADTNTGWIEVGYVATTTATAGPVVITFQGSTGGASCDLHEYTVSTGTPLLDYAQAAHLTTTGTTHAGVTSLLSGTNDLIIQASVGESTFSTTRAAISVNSPYSTGARFDATNGEGTANLLNTTSVTAPTWTYNGALGFTNVANMAFATNATPCSDVLVEDWSGGSNGTFATPALANAGSFGYPITGKNPAQGNGWATSTGSTLTTMKYVTNTLPGLHTPIRTCDGITRSGTPSLMMQYLQSITTNQYLLFGIPMGGLKTTAGFMFSTTYPGTDTTNHDEDGIGANTFNFVTLQVVGTGTVPAVQIECNGSGGTTNFSSQISLTSGTAFFASVTNDTAVGGSLTIYETTGWTSVGTVTCTASGWTVAVADTLQVGQGGSTADFPATVWNTGVTILNLHGTAMTP